MQRKGSATTLAGIHLNKVFYGWWIALAGSMAMALNAGINFYGFSAFFVPLISEFGWSRTALSGVFSLSRLEAGLTGPIGGYLTDKLGPRKVMLIGVPLMGIGFILLSQVNSLLMLYLVYILGVSLGSGFGFTNAVSAAVANWFNKKRGRAFGVLWSGSALGGGIFLPILGWLIVTYGWRTSAVIAGIMILALGLPIAIVMRHKPEQYGYLPDGASPTQSGTSVLGGERGIDPTSAAEENEMGPLESMKTATFWLLGVSMGLRSVVTTGFTIHFIPMLIDRDINPTVAAMLLGFVALISITGRLGLTSLGDAFSMRYLMAATMVVTGLTMLGMAQTQSMWIVLPLLVVYSVAYGGSVTLPLPLQAEYFGRNNFATIRGLIHTVQTGGLILGPIFAGYVYDTTESYTFAFLGFAAASFLGAILVMFARKPQKRPLNRRAG